MGLLLAYCMRDQKKEHGKHDLDMESEHIRQMAGKNRKEALATMLQMRHCNMEREREKLVVTHRAEIQGHSTIPSST